MTIAALVCFMVPCFSAALGQETARSGSEAAGGCPLPAGWAVPAQTAPHVVGQSARAGGLPSDTDVRQILFELRVVEVPRSRMGELGGNAEPGILPSVPGRHANDGILGQESVSEPPIGDCVVVPGGLGVIGDRAALLGRLEILRQEKIARIIAEPTLVAVSGRPVMFHSGSELIRQRGDGSEETVELGTRVELTATIHRPDRIDLNVRARFAELDQTRLTLGDRIPGVCVREFSTHLEMQSGQTLLLGGLARQARDPNEETIEMLVVITSTIVSVAAPMGSN